MKTFSFNPPINPSGKSKWVTAATSFEASNSLFNITNENKSFSITAPGYWTSGGIAATINKRRELLAIRQIIFY